jgi:hypothetical protein
MNVASVTVSAMTQGLIAGIAARGIAGLAKKPAPSKDETSDEDDSAPEPEELIRVHLRKTLGSTDIPRRREWSLF